MTRTALDLVHLAAELRAAMGRLTRLLREHAPKGELTQSQLFALGRLEREGPQTVTALARAEGVRPQSMGATVAPLQDMGLVAASPDPADGRQTILEATETARQLVKAHRAARESWLLSAIASRLTQKEQQELARAVTLLQHLAEPPEPRQRTLPEKEAPCPSPRSIPRPP
jgi:DNA-binding MarR family transcriptional regulator